MNGKGRIEAALSGVMPDTTPVMLHNFMMAAREAGVSMGRYRRSPEAMAEVFIRAVETYRYDGIVVDVDTATLAGAVGVPVEQPEDAPASCRAGVAALVLDAPPDISHYQGIEVWLEAVRMLRRYFGDEIYIRGNCDQAPFSLAALARSLPVFLEELLDEDRHEEIRRLIEWCARAVEQFLDLMAETGADMLSNGDSPAGPDMISPALYRKFAQPYECRVAAFAHSRGLPYVLHICGKTDRILEDMAATGADGLELDYKTDARAARRAFEGRAAFIGNIDPNAVLAMGTPALVEAKARELLEVWRGNPRFILNAGCAIPASTPPENLRAMIRAARDQ